MSGQHCILVIEDDPAIRRGLVDTLAFESFRTIQAATAPLALEAALTADCDLILLDLLLPGGDGLSILRRVRAARPTLPVIILTARGDEADRVAGLQLGADDYIVKPFSPRELVARVRAVLRRSPARPSDLAALRFDVAGITADLARREIRFPGGTRADLSDKEAELLRYLALHRQRALSRDELLAGVWQLDAGGTTTRTIDMHIARLREKLGDNAAEPQLILTVRGKGYMLGPVTAIPTDAPTPPAPGSVP